MIAARAGERSRGACAPVPGRAPGRSVLALACLLAIPAWASVRAVEHHVSDANQLGMLPPAQLAALSCYLRAHQGSARYEAAYDAATKMGALVVHDARPLLVLNSIESKVVTPLARLQALAAAGAVRYAVLSTPCGPHSTSKNAGLLGGRALGRGPRHERLRPAGLGHGLTLWRLPEAACRPALRDGLGSAGLRPARARPRAPAARSRRPRAGARRRSPPAAWGPG